MANQNAKIDENYKKTLTAITDDANAEIRRLLVDPTTGRLKVSAVIAGGGGITSLNGLTDAVQTFATGNTGTDFNIVSATGVHTFNLPNASATVRGLLSSADWLTFNGKQDTLGFTPENSANKKTSLTDNSDTYYPTQKCVKTAVDGKADATHASRHSVGGADAVFPADPGADRYLKWNDTTNAIEWGEVTGTGANTSLSNLTSVAINAALLPALDNTIALGNGLKTWSDLFLGNGAVIDFNNSAVTLTHSSNTLTLSGGNLALGANNLTMTGSLGATAARVTKGWFTDLEITNTPTINGTAMSSIYSPIAGSASIDTVGTITTGTWNGTVIDGQYGGTGVANTGKTITLGGNLTTSGAYALTLTLSNTTSVTLPTSGTLATLAGTEELTNKTLTSALIKTGLTPDTSDAAALGSTTKMFSDLFLASGGVINFNNGNATLTHSAGLLTSNVPLSLGTSNALTCGSIELGNASDTTLSRSAAGVLAVEGVVIPSISSTNTITNKRNQKRVSSASSASSLTPEIDTYDIFELTALAENLTINNHSSSTPVNGEMMMFIIKDNGTSRTITWGDKYANGCATLPTATTISKKTWILVQWNNTDGKWYCISVGTQS